MRNFLIVFVAAGLASCVTPVSMPQAPTVSSPAAQQCVDACQTDYAQCEQPCGVGSTAKRVPACQEKCYNDLSACYARCEKL